MLVLRYVGKVSGLLEALRSLQEAIAYHDELMREGSLMEYNALDRIIEMLAEENGLGVEEFEQDDEELVYGLDDGTAYVVRILRGIAYIRHVDGDVHRFVVAVPITNEGGEQDD